MNVRAGLPTDADALAELAARTFRDTFSADTGAEDLELFVATSYGPAQQGNELRDPGISTLLAYVDDQLAGFAQLRRKPAPDCVTGALPIELWRFYVAKEWHGHGVAQALMRSVDSDAIRIGARTLWLGVWERNERAKAFYRKVGFVDVGSHIFVVGTDAQTDRIMMRPVEATKPE